MGRGGVGRGGGVEDGVRRSGKRRRRSRRWGEKEEAVREEEKIREEVEKMGKKLNRLTGSDFRDYPLFFFISRRFINERSAANIRDWSLAYSFIWCKYP